GLAELLILRKDPRMDFKCPGIDSENVKARECPDAREGDVSLAIFKGPGEIYDRRIEAKTLALVDGDRPREPQGDLRDRRDTPCSILDAPVHRRDGNRVIIARSHDGVTGFIHKANDGSLRPVHEALARTVLCEHDRGVCLERQL